MKQGALSSGTSQSIVAAVVDFDSKWRQVVRATPGSQEGPPAGAGKQPHHATRNHFVFDWDIGTNRSSSVTRLLQDRTDGKRVHALRKVCSDLEYSRCA